MESEDPVDSPSTLPEYGEYARAIIDRFPQMDEANTKQKLVSPLIETLGWNSAFDVELEYSVQMGAGKKKVDYALTVNESPAVFVEAKGYDSTLIDSNRKQLKSYLKQQNVDWGLLTNGKRYEVMRRNLEDGDIIVETIGSVRLEEFPTKSTLLKTLSKESIESGQSHRFIQHMNALREAEMNLQENKDDLAEQVTREITDQVGDVVSQRVETKAKELIDELIEEFDSDASSPSELPEPAEPEDQFWKRVREETGITKNEFGIVLPEEYSGAESLANFVRFLFSEGELSNDNLPIESGRKRYLLNSEPVDQEGDKMKKPKEVRDGVYLETNYSRATIEAKIIELAELAEI